MPGKEKSVVAQCLGKTRSPLFEKSVRKADFIHMVDPKGIEPSTLRMRTVRSPRLSYGPKSTVPKAEQKNKAI